MTEVPLVYLASLLIRIQRRDELALNCLWDLYSESIFSISLRILKDPAAAEDVVQEVFLHLWQKPTAFDASRGSFFVWLVVVTRHRCIDLIRKRRPSDSLDDLMLTAPGHQHAEIERELMTRRARTLVQRLPRDQRRLVKLAFFGELTHVQIAAKTGVPLGTVKSKIRVGLRAIRTTLQQPGQALR